MGYFKYMNEDFIQFLWKHTKFDTSALRTKEGKLIELHSPGVLNTNEGPDFSNAKISIDGQVWIGNVEIHLKASDWFKHHHNEDKNYNNVILHVVYDFDMEVCDNNARVIPCLELRGRFKAISFEYFKREYLRKAPLICENKLKSMNPQLLNNMLSLCFKERLEVKSMEILDLLASNNGDWQESFHQLAAKVFGFPLNSEPMLILSQMISWKLIQRKKYDLMSVEALLFGTANLIAENDEYSISLNEEFQFLKQKYGLQSIESSWWKYSKMRPSNSPELRLAQYIYFSVSSKFDWTHLINEFSLDSVHESLKIPIGKYWQEHHGFAKPLRFPQKSLSTQYKDLLIINLILPFLFTYARHHKLKSLETKILDSYKSLKAEKNNVIKYYENCGFKIHNSQDSQGVLQLKKNYCQQKKCLNCIIGKTILKNEQN